MNNWPTFNEAVKYAKEHDEEFGKWLLENYSYSKVCTMNKLEKAAALGLFYFENH